MPDVIAPPIIGAAMRFITSAPDCVTGDHMIGSRPNKMAQTVMTFGRMRLHRAFNDGGMQIGHCIHSPCGPESFPCLVQIEQHDDARFGTQTGQGDEPHPHRHAHVVTEQIQKPKRADQRERHGQQNDDRFDD